jgi:hypothetical protein
MFGLTKVLAVDKPEEQTEEQKATISLVNECIAEGKIPQVVLARMQYNQEHLRNNPFVYIDKTTSKVIQLAYNAYIPDFKSKFMEDPSTYPKDPHIITIMRGIKAKALANPLYGQVVPATSEAEDKDAAEDCSLLLKYSNRELKEKELRKQIIGWIQPCGNVLEKVWWNKEKGEYIYEPDENGQPTQNKIKEGDVDCKIIAPPSFLKPKGIKLEDPNLPWCGEMYAMPIKKVKKIYGVDVKAETNLEDLRSLGELTVSGSGENKQLKDHAKLIELFFPPSEEHPNTEGLDQKKYGRHIIACDSKILKDDVFDPYLTAKFGIWHPYTYHYKDIDIEGDDWAKAIMDYLTDDQNQLNKNYKQIMDSKVYSKPIIVYQDKTIDWDKVNLNPSDGYPKLGVKQGATFNPSFMGPPNINQDLVQRHQMIKQSMNDKAAMYEVTRGNADPSITSGKQTEALQSANTLQHSPLLTNIADGAIARWVRTLQLYSVHLDPKFGRMIQIVGKNKEAVALQFTPDKIRSYNVIVSGGNNFFMTPEERRAELTKNFQAGLLGNPMDPKVKAKYLDMLEYGSYEEFLEEYTADIDMQKLENRMFAGDIQRGIMPQLEETDPYILQQIEKEFEEEYNAWITQGQQYEETMAKMAAGQIGPEQIMSTPPPQPPGPEPQLKMWRRARPYENHDIHIETLNVWRKTKAFEDLCKQFPQIREATDFHQADHERQKQLQMQKQLPMMPPLMPEQKAS